MCPVRAPGGRGSLHVPHDQKCLNNCPGEAYLRSEPCLLPTSLQSKLTKAMYYTIDNANAVR